MLALLLVLATVQDTTIVIHPDSSGATLQARELPRVVTDEVITFYNAPATTRLVAAPACRGATSGAATWRCATARCSSGDA